jgi:hypothetical protein
MQSFERGIRTPMSIDTGELWRAHQAARIRKHRAIEITQRVLDTPPAVLRTECLRNGIADGALTDDATLRRRLADHLLVTTRGSAGR